VKWKHCHTVIPLETLKIRRGGTIMQRPIIVHRFRRRGSRGCTEYHFLVFMVVVTDLVTQHAKEKMFGIIIRFRSGFHAPVEDILKSKRMKV
jgi:hypothetical protein